MEEGLHYVHLVKLAHEHFMLHLSLKEIIQYAFILECVGLIVLLFIII